MELEEMQKLYDTSMDFRLYVSGWQKKTGMELWELFQLISVQEYAQYVQERESNA